MWSIEKSAKMTFFKNGQKVAFGEKVVVRVNFGHFWCQFCLDLLVSSFWPRSCLLSNLFGLSKKWPPNRHFWRLFVLSRCQQKWRFGGQFFESPNKLLKMHLLGQNELTKKSKQNWHLEVPKTHFSCLFWFWSKFAGWPLKRPKSPNWDLSTFFVCCPFELKIYLGAL